MFKNSKCLMLTFFLLSFTIMFSQNDTLVVKSGNTIHGEVKGMNKGVLKMKTSYSDSDFAIEWDKVTKLITSTEFLINTSRGERYNGKLRSINDKELIILSATDTLAKVFIQDIVFMQMVKSDFLSKLSASIALGYNFTKSNNFKQFSLRSTLGYQAKRWSSKANYNDISSNRDDTDAVKRIDAALSYRYYLRKDWFPLAEVNWLSNTEQDLKLRTVSKLGMGKYLKRNNRLYWGVQAGVSYNNESFSNANSSSLNSAEGFFGSELNLYDVGDLNLLARIIAYPGITESGRWRFDSNMDLKYDLPLDFFIKVGFSVNYDNQSVNPSGNYDYVVQTTFGWEL